MNGGYDDQTSYNLNIDWELPFADLHFLHVLFRARKPGGSRGRTPRPPGGIFQLCKRGVWAGRGAGPWRWRHRELLTERTVQELRLISNTDGPLQWTLGAYYKDDESRQGLNAPCYKGGGSPVYAALDICTVYIWLFSRRLRRGSGPERSDASRDIGSGISY